MRRFARALYARALVRNPRLARLLLRARLGAITDTVKHRVRGKRNEFIHADAILKRTVFDVVGDDNRITVGPDCILDSVTFHIRGNGHRVAIGPGCRIGGPSVLWLEDEECSLQIGAGSTFEGVHIAVTEPGSRITIGDDCMFAYDIEVRSGDSHPIIAADTGERLNPAQDVTIGDHVWVGVGAKVLKGAVIAACSVVATGAIVTMGSPEEGATTAGIPAVVARSGITWKRERT